jgi:hypothetical protein
MRATIYSTACSVSASIADLLDIAVDDAAIGTESLRLSFVGGAILSSKMLKHVHDEGMAVL